MKVYLSKYRNHWLSPYTILEHVCFWRVFEDYNDPWMEKWANRLEPLCLAWQWFLDRVHPKINYVKIDYWDTWSMDHTLAHMIVPMLKQLQATKHGSPQVEDEDVPEHLRSTAAPPKENDWDTDDNLHLRWEWVMNEMIWTFEQQIKDNSDSQFYDHSAVNPKAGINTQIGQIKVDRDGLDAWQERKTNGFRLFGKYYQGLWD
jgi:hypothetical protein